MKTWGQLRAAAQRLGLDVTTAHGTDATIVDAGTRQPLATLSCGRELALADRDRVTRAGLGALLLEIRRARAERTERVNEPGTDTCVRDDSTECECRRCCGAQADWERAQGWDADGAA